MRPNSGSPRDRTFCVATMTFPFFHLYFYSCSMAWLGHVRLNTFSYIGITTTNTESTVPSNRCTVPVNKSTPLQGYVMIWCVSLAELHKHADRYQHLLMSITLSLISFQLLGDRRPIGYVRRPRTRADILPARVQCDDPHSLASQRRDQSIQCCTVQ